MLFTRTPCASLVRVVLVWLAAMLAASVSAQTPEPVFPGSSRIGLVPPSGMTPSATFSGFEHSSGASILLVELPGEAYPDLAERFTPDGLRQTGFEMTGEADALTLAGGEGLLARGTQRAHGVVFRKWVTIRRQQGLTAMVTIQVPEGTEAIPGSAVEAALATIAIRPASSPDDQLASLPYSIGDLAGFRIVRGLFGNSLLLTDGPKDVDPDGDQPMVVVTHSLGDVWTAGQELAFARKAAGDIDQLDDIAITSERRFDGPPAIVTQLRGQAQDATTGRDLVFSQTIQFQGSDYLRVIAIAPPEHAEALDRAERLAGSIAMRVSH